MSHFDTFLLRVGFGQGRGELIKVLQLIRFDGPGRKLSRFGARMLQYIVPRYQVCMYVLSMYIFVNFVRGVLVA